MTLAEDREEIRLAIDGVDGIYGYGDFPSQLNVGDASVRWGGFDSASMPPGVFASMWKILVVTGGTPQDAMAFADSRLADVIDAVSPELLYVTGVQPVDFADVPLWGVEVTGMKES